MLPRITPWPVSQDFRSRALNVNATQNNPTVRYQAYTSLSPIRVANRRNCVVCRAQPAQGRLFCFNVWCTSAPCQLFYIPTGTKGSRCGDSSRCAEQKLDRQACHVGTRDYTLLIYSHTYEASTPALPLESTKLLHVMAHDHEHPAAPGNSNSLDMSGPTQDNHGTHTVAAPVYSLV